jgi:hypothetical protein
VTFSIPMIESIGEDQDLRTEDPRTEASRLSRRSLITLGTVVTSGRFLMSADREIPGLSPDEFATFGMARFLSGGHWNMYYAPTWRPGLSTIIAPLFWLFDDPVWVLRGGLLVNALLGGVAAIWLALILMRLVDVSTTRCGVICGVVALAPASINASSYLWAEPLVTVCSLAVVWYLLRYFDEPRTRTALAAIVWAVIGFTSHSRLLPLVVLATAIVASHAWVARARARTATFVAVAIILSALSVWFARWIIGAVWQVPSPENTTNSVFRRLLHPADVLDAAVGQVWYQLAATALLFGFGMVWLVRQALGSAGSAARRDARIVVLITTVLMSVSIVFMSGRTRADHLVYGRYNDAILWPVVAVGLAWVTSAGWGATTRARTWTVTAVAVVSVELAVVVNQLHHPQLDQRPIGAMIPGIVPLMSVLDTAHPVAVTAVALAVAAGLLMAVSSRSPTRSALALLVVGVLLVPGAVLVRRVRVANDPEAYAQSVEQVQTVVPRGEPIGFIFQLPEDGAPIPLSTQLNYALMYQWYLAHNEFKTRAELSQSPRYLFGVDGHPVMKARGAQVVWSAPDLWAVLWREESD